MKVKFPAMQATIGQRTYYVCVMKLTAIPKMFTFRDWIEFTPEDREQRVLNKNRIPDIARYILDNEDGYLFSSITASYQCPVRFEPVNADGLGFLEMDFEDADFVINDGQHRCAAIAQAIKENPALGDESMSVLLFPYESKERVQQMFADLNRYVVKPNMATNIIFDHHDTLGRVTKEVCEKVAVFQGLVDKEHQSLPARSEKAFTLYSLYDATKELLAERASGGDGRFEEMVQAAVEYWTTVSTFMADWQKVKNREIRPIELRQENISTHAVVLRALGGVGAELLARYPSDWKSRVAGIKAIDWSKRNRDWENVCMVANSVVANRQARVATKAYLKRKLGLPVSEAEQNSIAHLQARIGSEVPTGDAGTTTTSLVHHTRQQVAKPRELRIGASSERIRAWADVPVVAANWLLAQGIQLKRLEHFLHEEDSGFTAAAQTRELNNGWFIEIGDDRGTLLRKARRVLDACGQHGVAGHITLEDGTTKAF